MGKISKYASHKILDFLLGRNTLTVPESFHIALSTTVLGADGEGMTEPDDISYERVIIPNNKINFSVAKDKTVTIIKEFVFPETTKDWGETSSFVIFDDLDNVWFYGKLKNSLDVEIETSPIIDADTNSFTFDICGGSTTDMAITTDISHNILDFLLGNSHDLTPPENYYIGVSSTEISTEGIGMTEPMDSSYERLKIPNDKNSFTDAENKTVTFNKEFRFKTAEVDWGKMTHYFISDSPSGGNIWWSGKLVHSRNVDISTTLVIKPNGFKWVLDSCEPVPEAKSVSYTTRNNYWGK